ncbi:hypothetical protein PCASD_22755 [Puccinia coronata f. sp. avenae]|uniref:Uncharacterized protein n=1 Tax=Puccinia coronata f. sp. avenae TaxID=200324 RepID=A0A2N5SAE7_9BASI|nr:hypothetical protein PCASD_22755 [Puccinia coronata f. sp. avenae]
MWSYLSNLVSPLRYATRNHRFASTSHRLAHHNRRGIQGLAHWLRRKFNNALKRRREVRNTLAKLLTKPNPHSASGKNYSQGFFQQQWIAQQGFHADHTDVEELRMKKMASLYQRENVIDLLRNRLLNPRTLLASPSKVQELLNSFDKELDKLQEELEQLSGENLPAENIEERKLRLLLWSAKSDLFIQAVQLRAERQPLLDSKNLGRRLGTKLKEKVFNAINNRRPAIEKLINVYNSQYTEFKAKFPHRVQFERDNDGHLSYERLSSMPLDDSFWNDGLFYHCDAPWAINPEVREGINCVLMLSRVQEEFELIAQEVV